MMNIRPETRELFKKIFKVLAPPPNMTLSEWADKYRYLSPEAAARPGRWHTENTPYLREIMDAISDTAVKKVVAMLGAQLGKTEGLILNTIGYYMHFDPSPILVMQPTIDLGETFSKDRLTPMLRDTPVLRGKVNDKSRSSGNTILKKHFPGGHIAIVGANSPIGLRSRPIRILLADEIDGYPASAGEDGDPLYLVSKRIATFWNKKEVHVSTPILKGTSKIEREYNNSTMEEWCVPCPVCGELQPLQWKHVLFDANNLDEISYSCEKCGCVSSEAEWKEHFTEGKYIAAHPERETRGFHVNSLASMFMDWKKIVQDFLTANEEKKKGNIETLKAWTNLNMAETWADGGEQVDEEALFKRREKYNCEVPADVLYLTAGVDTQDDRLEAEVVGWGEGAESWGIRYAVFYGDTKLQKVWDDLDAFLLQTFERADGAKMKIICTCIDSGGHRANNVYKFCKARSARRVYAIRGQGGDVPYIKRPTKNNREQAILFTLGVDVGKSILYDRLKVEPPEDETSETESMPGYCHFPRGRDRGYTREYFRGLPAEHRVLTYKKGVPVYEWRIKDAAHKRNEALDVRNYATAALEISNVTLKKLDNAGAAAPKRRAGRRRRSSGGVI